jgi:uncharacterized membrane protein YgdD (TMEM256/DUF423 family)
MDQARRIPAWWVSVAALNGLLAVAAGAFAAHALKHSSDPQAAMWVETAATYQMWHALALLGVSAVRDRGPGSGWVRISAWLFVTGILLFSGSLYVLALSPARWVAWITPFGGTAFLLGWLALLVHGLRGAGP